MRTAGIIGGLSRQTTAEFYLRVMSLTNERNKIHQPPILLWSIPLNYKVEEKMIKETKGEEGYLPYLIEAAQKLEKGGADFIVMPCNTMHVFIDQIKKSVRIPVIDIIEETIRIIRNNKIKKAGILATSLTLKSKMFQDNLRKNGIIPILPVSTDQSKLSRIIFNIVKTTTSIKDKKILESIVDRMVESHVEAVILACTDLQLLNPKRKKIKVFDTMEILARTTVDMILN